MKSRYITAVAAGVMLGAAAGMLMAPQVDKGTKKRIRRTGRMMKDTAGDMYENMKGWMR